MLHIITDLHLHHITLWYLVQHSLPSYRKLIAHFGSAEQAVSATQLLKWSELKIHKNHISRAENFHTAPEQALFLKCLEKIKQHTDFILLDTEETYPKQLLPYPDRPPILFGLGQYQHLSQPQVAIVGSRKPSPHGQQVAYDFAFYLSEKGFFVTSGLAQGIDAAAHLGALKHLRTIAVIGTGLDQIYPSQNSQLQQQILAHSGTVISEFLPETKPLQQHFPRRNRIVSGLSLGVLVAEATLGSGSLITAKAAADQGKITFAIPGHIYSEHHQGCHQLIREGAILVDHPDQIIEDLALPTQWQIQQNNTDETETNTSTQAAEASTLEHIQTLQNTDPLILQQANKDQPAHTDAQHFKSSSPLNLALPPELPPELFRLYQQLDWVGQDLDQLAKATQLNTAALTSDLMQLELMGLCLQQAGLYLRCRMSH